MPLRYMILASVLPAPGFARQSALWTPATGLAGLAASSAGTDTSAVHLNPHTRTDASLQNFRLRVTAHDSPYLLHASSSFSSHSGMYQISACALRISYEDTTGAQLCYMCRNTVLHAREGVAHACVCTGLPLAHAVPNRLGNTWYVKALARGGHGAIGHGV